MFDSVFRGVCITENPESEDACSLCMDWFRLRTLCAVPHSPEARDVCPVFLPWLSAGSRTLGRSGRTERDK